MPQPLRSTRLVWKTLTCLPSEARRGHAPTFSEGRANAQADDSSRCGLLKPVSEDAATKPPTQPPHQGNWERGPRLKPPSRRPRQEKAQEQVEEGPIPPPLLPAWTGTSWVTQTLTCSEDAERSGSPRRLANRLAEPEAGRLRAGSLTTKLTSVEQGAFHLSGRPGQGSPGAAGKPGILWVCGPAPAVPSVSPGLIPSSVWPELPWMWVRRPSGTGRGGWTLEQFGASLVKEAAWRKHSLYFKFHLLL